MSAATAAQRAEAARYRETRDAEQIERQHTYLADREQEWKSWLEEELGSDFVFQGYPVQKLFWYKLRQLRELYLRTPGVALPTEMTLDNVNEIAEMVNPKSGHCNPRRCWIVRCGKETAPERDTDGVWNQESVYLCPAHRRAQMRRRGEAVE